MTAHPSSTTRLRAVLLAAILAGRAAAQEASPADALTQRGWIGLGLAAVDHAPYESRGNFLTLSLRIAGNGERLRGWGAIELGANQRASRIPLPGADTISCADRCLQLLWSLMGGVEYQWNARGPFVLAGIGYSKERLMLGGETDVSSATGASGLGAVVGLGWELRNRPRPLVPFLVYTATPTFDEGGSRGGAAMHRLMLGVGLGGNYLPGNANRASSQERMPGR